MSIIKHNPIVTANVAAATTALIYVLCRVLVGLFPDLSFTIAQSWFHGIALSKFDSGNITLESLTLGIISSTITAWIIGYIFASIYSFFLKGK